MERIPTRLASVALVLAALAAIVLAGGGRASAATASDALPDLVADPPARAQLDYYAYSDGSHDLLLRFDGYVHNIGTGALDVRGSRASTTATMPPLQRVYRTDGSSHDDAMPGAQLFYSNADGHRHWHLQDVARYSLWNDARSAEVAPALKVGFCLEDGQHVDPYGPASALYTDGGVRFCQKDQPSTLSVFEGVSSGWRDVYDRSLALQWVVVSDVQPGPYWLREEVDTGNIVHEASETNPPAWSTSEVTIPGYVARALTPAGGAYEEPQQLTLDADSYGAPGARRFRIVTPPAHGSLSVGADGDFSDPAVTYTPAPGFSGADHFTYAALDSTSSYPIHPATATVALTVGAAPAASVVIDGAPTALATGRGVQLHATVANDFPSVTWSVDGVDGGSAAKGTITPAGFYRAPAHIPAAGHVTIAARSTSGAHDERVVRIVAPPDPIPSPGLDVSGEHYSSGPALLSRIAVVRRGHVLAAAVTPRRAGVVSIAARLPGRYLGTCHAKTPKLRRFTCRVNLPPGVRLRHLKLVARLRRGHVVVATARRVGAP